MDRRQSFFREAGALRADIAALSKRIGKGAVSDSDARSAESKAALAELFEATAGGQEALRYSFAQHGGNARRSAGPFSTLGEQLECIYRAETEPTEPIDNRLLQKRAASGLSEAVPADAGFLIQDDFASRLIAKVLLTGEFLRRTTSFPITKEPVGNLKINGFDESSRADGSRFGGVRGYWGNEAATVTATRPKFRQIDISLKKLLALCYVTNESISDSTLLGAAVEMAFVSEFRYLAERAAFFGDGVDQMQGFMNSPALVSVTKSTGQAAGSVNTQNIVNIWASMWGPSRSRGVWFVHQDLEPQLLTLALPIGTAGSEARLYVPTEDPDNQPFNLLLGRPCIPCEYSAAPGTTGDIALVDPGEYLLVEKDPVDMAVSVHATFLTDEQAFRFRWRLNGQPMWHKPLTPANSSNTLSPFVALATRA